ncbi:hypothetical protein HELRODRAFT_161007 [Helobdella robusta]|uniref:Protein kinase domain-containing protein n=1 Tax=Helobdella robusta TaxID=6412 RepID=T1ER01_HELRO|nr:hypothetical protein HELRODRAFT_161007 [Helobdella robusta]ESO01836.1 hypothetical protein HELRODRAFT_161007 [Helobdella robusta]
MNQLDKLNYKESKLNIPIYATLEECLSSLGYTFNYDVIGFGRRCEVVKAWSERNKKQVAVKVIDKLAINDNDYKIKLTEELSLWSKLYHPNVIELIEYANNCRWTFSVMELALEGDLNTWLRTHVKSPSADQARMWVQQITNGLHYLKLLGYSHGDVKPSNILVYHKTLKVCDFDCSKILDGKLSEVFCGSFGYIAPEVFRKEPYDPEKADVWSLGVTAYVVTTNECNSEKNFPQTFVFKLKKNWDAFVPKDARSLLKRMLTRNADSRCDMEHVVHHRWFTPEHNIEAE